MSMPKIPDIDPIINLDRIDILNLLLSSVALEEIAISEILTAQSQLVNFFVCNCKCQCDPDNILELTSSLEKILGKVESFETTLIDKLKTVDSMYEKELKYQEKCSEKCVCKEICVKECKCDCHSSNNMNMIKNCNKCDCYNKQKIPCNCNKCKTSNMRVNSNMKNSNGAKKSIRNSNTKK